jgi:2-polyprenyl-3-methyl-5-hydroxy-6-metoxy-1,4-benzoquinol methylase
MEWFILILVALGLWLVVHMHEYGYVYEGFEDGGSTSKKEAGAPTEERHDYDSIYDDFYASVYSKLFETPGLISFQKASIRENALAEWPKKDIKLLDVCCGVAPLAEWLCKEGVDVVGVDQSEAMLKKAVKRVSRHGFIRRT